MDPALTKSVKPGEIGNEGRILWMHASVDYRGKYAGKKGRGRFMWNII